VAITSLHVAGCPDGGKMSIWRLHGCHCRCDRPRIAARPASPRLHNARRAIVIISKASLASSWSRKELDGLTTRSGVVAILPDIIEADVAGHSSGLAVAASPGSPSKRLVGLLRAGEETGSFEFSLTRRRPRSHAAIADSGDESTLCGRDTLRQRRWSPLP